MPVSCYRETGTSHLTVIISNRTPLLSVLSVIQPLLSVFMTGTYYIMRVRGFSILEPSVKLHKTAVVTVQDTFERSTSKIAGIILCDTWYAAADGATQSHRIFQKVSPLSTPPSVLNNKVIHGKRCVTRTNIKYSCLRDFRQTAQHFVIFTPSNKRKRELL